MSSPRRTTRLSDQQALLLLRRADPAAPDPAMLDAAVLGTEAPVPGVLDARARADLDAILTARPGGGPAPAAAGTPRPSPRPHARPRTGRWLRPVLVTALPLAATTTVALVVAAGLSQPCGAQLASWTAVPATAPGAQAPDADIREWASRCSDLTGTGLGIGGLAPERDPSAPRQLLVDQRGELTFCIDYYRGAGTDAHPTVMLTGLRGEDLQQGWATVIGAGSPTLTPPTGDDVLVMGGDSTTVRSRDEDGSFTDTTGQASMLYGMAGPQVSGVEVVLANGLEVTATLDGGLWGAWWPAAEGEVVGAMLTLHTPEGTRTLDPARARLD